MKMKPEEIENIRKAGQISVQVKEYARKIIEKGKPLLEIAEQIESKIIELGGKLAFPTNLSINEIAAHSTPKYNSEETAQGLLKVDLGVHINGWTADTAFSLDLENSDENKKLIQASEKALNQAINAVKEKKNLGEIGKKIQDTIDENGFSPIQNLSGHQIKQYELHAGLTIPNYDNKNAKKLNDGLYAIEPFATTGQGKVYDSKDSGIYQFIQRKSVRDSKAREILNFIEQEYKGLPFCSRWIIKKFSPRALISLKQLEQVEAIHQFKQLHEQSHKPVSQTEHTILIQNNKVEIVTA